MGLKKLEIKYNCLHCYLNSICTHNILPNDSGHCNYFIHVSSPTEWKEKQKEKFMKR